MFAPRTCVSRLFQVIQGKNFAGLYQKGQQSRSFPVCTIDTSIPKTDVPADFPQKVSTTIAETLNKPENLVSVIVRTDATILRGGDSAASAHVHLWSVGVFDEEKNVHYSKVFMDLITSQLKLDHNRVSVFLHPIERHDAAHLLYTDQLQTSTEQS